MDFGELTHHKGRKDHRCIKLIGPVGFTDGPLDDLKPPAHPTTCPTCGGMNGHEDGCEVSK